MNSVFDEIVVGETERAVLEMLKDMEKGIESERIYSFAMVENLDNIPFPTQQLLPFESVFNDRLVTPSVFAEAVITSRGCPYECSFCASKENIEKNRMLQKCKECYQGTASDYKMITG